MDIEGVVVWLVDIECVVWLMESKLQEFSKHPADLVPGGFGENSTVFGWRISLTMTNEAEWAKI